MSDQFNSAELAGGNAVGVNGKIRGFNADVEARLADVLLSVGKWVEKEAGALMGHIKLAVTNGTQTVTMNLTDLSEGVLYHGKVRPSPDVDFTFMAAVLDVDGHELEHKVYHALEDSGINMHLENHHHHHDGECSCGHDHHHHHHEHDHDHHHDHHEHDHHHGSDCKCGCHHH